MKILLYTTMCLLTANTLMASNQIKETPILKPELEIGDCHYLVTVWKPDGTHVTAVTDRGQTDTALDCLSIALEVALALQAKYPDYNVKVQSFFE